MYYLLLSCVKVQSYQAGAFSSRIILPFRRNLLLVQDGRHLSPKAPVVQKVDSAIHWINYYPVDNATGFCSMYPLESNLTSG